MEFESAIVMIFFSVARVSMFFFAEGTIHSNFWMIMQKKGNFVI